MYEYKLDAHLSQLCAAHPEYTNLYSTWTLNKRTCTDALKSVVFHYPHFSMHDASHAEAVVSKMEMLLGDRVQNLSPTDTWLLLHAAYAHDLGMVVQWSEIEATWETPEFQEFLSSLTHATDPELRDAAAFVQSLGNADAAPLWPLKTHRYVNLINAAYFRGRHAQMSQNYIHTLGAGLDLDLGHSSLIQSRILKLLGLICQMHTAPLSQVLTLDYQTDGFGSDYTHPRFVAMLLRLGDLLDIDNGRFNTASELTFGGLPETSQPHKEKHNATTHLLVTPKEIQFRSDCPNSRAYLEARTFVSWLEAEVDFFTKYWAKVAPENLGGYAPRFDRKELLINGVPDIEGVAGLRFAISQEKAFQILEGSNIYKNRLVFLREVIQNAMDTSKLQLWRDLVSGTYHAWMGELDFSRLQPYDLDEHIYKSYPIQINLTTLPDDITQIEISDRGTGISVDSFKRMCSVGVSNAGSKQIQKEIQDMPNWLRPTAGFGIGLQSIFLITDQFEIDTSTGTEAFHAVVHSNRTGGYLQLQRSDLPRPRGTTIRVRCHVPKPVQYSIRHSLSYQFDPMALQNHLGEAFVLESVRASCGDSMFPIRVSSSQDYLEGLELMATLPVCESGTAKQWDIWEGRYRFQLEDDCTHIKIWDTQSAAYVDIVTRSRWHPRDQVRFKGIDVSSSGFWYNKLSFSLDIYGLDTKQSIYLDRSSLTPTGLKQARNILNQFIRVYKECVLARLSALTPAQAKQLCAETEFDPYAFWLLCDFPQRAQIPNHVLAQIQDTATVFVRNKKGQYTKQEKLVRELIPFDADSCFLNLDNFDTDMDLDSVDYKKIGSVLNRAGLELPLIIADPSLTEAANEAYCRTLRIPCLEDALFVYTVSEQNTSVLDMSEPDKRLLLRGLSDFVPGFQYNVFPRADRIPQRFAIPALSDYRALAVSSLASGIPRVYLASCYHIMAPFNREEAKQKDGLSREQFVHLVTSAPTFANAVDYVMEHAVFREFSREQVIEAYTRLISDYYDATTPV